MKRYLTLKKRVKAKDRPFHASIQHDYKKPKPEDKEQLKLL